MKKLCSIFALILITINVFCQQIYPIKETYDQVLEPYYSSIDYNNNASRWWQSWGWVLMSYLRMYQVTNDKAYLNKFIKHSYGIQLNRRSSPPDWKDDLMLFTGQLIRPMAEFVFIVKNDNSLYNTNLMPGLVPSIIGTRTILGYGDFANWLQGRVAETLNHYNSNYWLNDDKCYDENLLTNCEKNCANSGCSGINCVFCNCPEPAVINFQASYAAALFFIGYVDPANFSNYTHKAEQIVTFFKNRVSEYTPNQSYTWFHDDTYREDVSHGGIDIQIPLVAYLLYGNGLYQPSQMNKFAHTFTYNIWDRYNQVFHNNVFGTDNDIDPAQNICVGTIPSNGTQNFYGPGEVLTWMPLYPFDDYNAAPNDIYTVLVTQAVKLLTDDPTAFLPTGYCNSITHYLSGTQSFYGLSEVVKAQWDKECVNLNLFNRDVVYDQDFIVKNNIIVAPQMDFTPPSSSTTYYTAGVTDPFAEPKIFTDNGTKDRFIIESGVSVNMVAGQSIELLPGFETKEGSSFRASINSSSCNDDMRISNPNGDFSTFSINSTKSVAGFSKKNTFGNFASEKINKTINLPETSLNSLQTFFIYPNPFKQETNVGFELKEANEVNIQVYDVAGKLMMEKNLGMLSSGKYLENIQVGNLESGFYFIRLNVGMHTATKKVSLLK